MTEQEIDDLIRTNAQLRARVESLTDDLIKVRNKYHEMRYKILNYVSNADPNEELIG